MNPPRPHRALGAGTLPSLALLAILVIAGATTFAQKADAKASGDANQQGLALAAAQSSPMTLGLVFSRASYGNPQASYNTAAVLNADLSMLLSTNVRCIRIDIGYAPWLQDDQTTINEITSLVQAIRAADRCLIVADAASETYRHGGQLPWSEFKAAWVSRVSSIAALYHPDYYVVVKEPGWYVPMVSDATTNPEFQSVKDWLGLTQNLTEAVQAASPATVVGVAIAANSLVQANGAFYSQYLNEVQAISGVSFIGFDIYSQNDQTATQGYLSKNSPSKPVWIPEAWSTGSGAPLNGDPSQDAQWLTNFYSFASSIHAEFCIPFYTDDFASYALVTNPPTNSDQILSYYQQRTPIYAAFESLVAAASSATTSTSSTVSSTSSGFSSSSSGSTTVASSSSAQSTVSHVSSQTSHTATGSKAGGAGGLFSAPVVALEVVVLIVLVGVILYFYRRRQ